MSLINFRFLYSVFLVSSHLLSQQGRTVSQPDKDLFAQAEGVLNLTVWHCAWQYTLRFIDPGAWVFRLNREILRSQSCGQASLVACLLDMSMAPASCTS